MRGDVNSIRVGDRVNIQDGSVLHTLYQKSTIEIGNDVSIGHNVVIHGAKIHDYALIGMGAVVMDDAVVGEGALVAAGSVVLSRTQIGPHEMWAGSPAKFIKMVEPEKAKEMNVKIAKNYLMYSNGMSKMRKKQTLLPISYKFLANFCQKILSYLEDCIILHRFMSPGSACCLPETSQIINRN